MTILLLICAIILNATANILMKLGAQRMGGLSLNIEGLKNFLTNPIIWAGVTSFGLTLVLYTYVLSKMKLSVAYPLMTSLGFLIVVSFSVLYLKEAVHWPQVVGLLLVIGGLYLIAQYQ